MSAPTLEQPTTVMREVDVTYGHIPTPEEVLEIRKGIRRMWRVPGFCRSRTVAEPQLLLNLIDSLATRAADAEQSELNTGAHHPKTIEKLLGLASGIAAYAPEPKGEVSP